MGERHSDDGPPGRRRAHPGGPVPGPRPADPGTALEARFGTALRPDGAGLDPAAERRAVAAFRAARDTGADRARTRRRDDWRPRASRRARFSVTASLSAFLASVTLGGLAVAAIASAGAPAHRGDEQPAPHPTADTSERPASVPAPEPSGPRPATSQAPVSPAPTDPAATESAAVHARPDRPATAKDTLAHCRAYEQVKDRGKALNSAAWQRLVTAAGGAEKVAAYCAGRLAAATTTAEEPGAGR
ncbi:hypothetical protein [Streptomyces shenzhenensis]|uniref:hypothetical protein n=1 Tax=Streptomyces shenzhenensis TaxID=943815 RepID=UPI0033F5D02A